MRMSDPMVLGVADDGSRATARRSLPLSLPPRLVDTAVVVVLALLYVGYVVGNVLTLHGWTPHLIAVAAGAPTVLAFFWRRPHPLVVPARCRSWSPCTPQRLACRCGGACWPGRALPPPA
jgi:hypothetical protein